MKKALWLGLIFLLSLHTTSFAAFTNSSTATEQKENFGAFKNAETRAAAEFFVKLSRKDYEQITGRHLSLAERLAFKVTQKHVKHELKKVPLTYGFNIGGFIMGLLLSVIGVVLAYLFSHDSNLQKWAWIGAILNVLILILIL